MITTWQPIETAPKDGTRFLGVWLGTVVIAQWNVEVNNWQEWPDGDFQNCPNELAFWMPLPHPPNATEKPPFSIMDHCAPKPDKKNAIYLTKLSMVKEITKALDQFLRQILNEYLGRTDWTPEELNSRCQMVSADHINPGRQSFFIDGIELFSMKRFPATHQSGSVLQFDYDIIRL